MQKRVWLFKEGNADMRNLLGGKGANLAEMTNLGLPVPPGLTITTETCMDYINHGNKMPEGLMDEVKEALKVVEQQKGQKPPPELSEIQGLFFREFRWYFLQFLKKFR